MTTEANAQAQAAWDSLTEEQKLEIRVKDNFVKPVQSTDDALEATRVNVAAVQQTENMAITARNNDDTITYMLFDIDPARKFSPKSPDAKLCSPKAVGKGYDEIGVAWKKQGQRGTFYVIKIKKESKNASIAANQNEKLMA
jgi:uncharacterized protein (DUF736 family)